MPCIHVDTSASGDTTLAAAPGNHRFIRVVALDLTSDGDTQVTLKGGSTEIWSTYATGAAAGGIVLPASQERQLDCPVNTALVLNSSGAVAIAGTVTYAIKGPPSNA